MDAEPRSPNAPQALDSERAPAQTRRDRVLAHGGMHDRYSGPLKLLFGRLFGPMLYPDEARLQVEAHAKTGTVVYVARAPSLSLALYFNYAIANLGLPLPKYVGGINLLLLQPVDRIWAYWRSRKLRVTRAWSRRFAGENPTRKEALLAEVAYHGGTAFIFLKPQRTLTTPGETDRNDYFRALVAVQRVSERPIYLFPHAVADKTQSGSARRTLTDRLFGDRRNPGRLRRLVMMLSPLRQAQVRVGAPIDLKELLAQSPGADDTLLARKVRHELHKRISDEERVIAGPTLASYETVARHVMRAPALRSALEQRATETGESLATLETTANAHLKHIAARYNVRWIWVLSGILRWVFSRIYDGLVVDQPGLEQVTQVARRGPVIFCPTHRSHIDYLVLSYVLWLHGVTPPHIAAGANLSFFPLGPIFRGAGAFFLRRTFKEDPVYAAVFRAYVGELLRAGTSLEFFPEGTRSRTGKTLMPKFGMFTMITDAWRAGAREDVQFVPVSIDYDRIIEAGAYERELLGGEKQAEDVKGLLSTTKVLRSRYGRVHLQFGRPVSLAQLARERGLGPETSEDTWRVEIERLGFRIVHDAAMVCSVTPTAVVSAVLLTHRGRGLAESALVQKAAALIDFLDVGAARLSESLQDPELRTDALLGTIRDLVEEGLVSVDRPGLSAGEPFYRVPEARRILVDYYKNAIMNHLAPSAMVARAITRRGLAELRHDDIAADVRFLSRLFKREFIFRADSGFGIYFDDVLASLAVRGVLDVHEDGAVVVHDADALQALAATLDNFLEGYWSTCRTLRDLRRFPLWERELVSRAIDQARRAYLEGDLTRPEAANRTMAETAIATFVGMGVLTVSSSGRRKTVGLTPEYEGNGLDQLLADIGEYT